MDPSFPPDYSSIPYTDAPAELQAEARRQVQAIFEAQVPPLTAVQWQEAMRRCYPVLEVGDGTVELREDDLTRLATYLLLESLADLPIHRAYCGAARHVAYKLLGFVRRAITALEQAAALPPGDLLEALELYKDALESMTGGDAVAMSIMEAFAFKRPAGTRAHRVYPRAEPAAEGDTPALTALAVSRKRAVQYLPEHWDHLQLWFRRAQDPARPWNVSNIARQLKLSQPVMRALLTAPKGAPGVSRTAFSQERLYKLQRYFRRYGYEPPTK